MARFYTVIDGQGKIWARCVAASKPEDAIDWVLRNHKCKRRHYPDLHAILEE